MFHFSISNILITKCTFFLKNKVIVKYHNNYFQNKSETLSKNEGYM